MENSNSQLNKAVQSNSPCTDNPTPNVCSPNVCSPNVCSSQPVQTTADRTYVHSTTSDSERSESAKEILLSLTTTVYIDTDGIKVQTTPGHVFSFPSISERSENLAIAASMSKHYDTISKMLQHLESRTKEILSRCNGIDSVSAKLTFLKDFVAKLDSERSESTPTLNIDRIRAMTANELAFTLAHRWFEPYTNHVYDWLMSQYTGFDRGYSEQAQSERSEFHARVKQYDDERVADILSYLLSYCYSPQDDDLTRTAEHIYDFINEKIGASENIDEYLQAIAVYYDYIKGHKSTLSSYEYGCYMQHFDALDNIISNSERSEKRTGEIK